MKYNITYSDDDYKATESNQDGILVLKAVKNESIPFEFYESNMKKCLNAIYKQSLDNGITNYRIKPIKNTSLSDESELSQVVFDDGVRYNHAFYTIVSFLVKLNDIKGYTFLILEQDNNDTEWENHKSEESSLNLETELPSQSSEENQQVPKYSFIQRASIIQTQNAYGNLSDYILISSTVESE